MIFIAEDIEKKTLENYYLVTDSIMQFFSHMSPALLFLNLSV
jgi:hypothetical protein